MEEKNKELLTNQILIYISSAYVKTLPKYLRTILSEFEALMI